MNINPKIALKSKWNFICCLLHTRGQSFVANNANVLLLLFGFVLLAIGLDHAAYAQQLGNQINVDTTDIDRTRCALYALIEGPYGALLTATAGFGAAVSAVFGNYKTAYNFLIVGVGCFIARSVDSMYFGTVDCQQAAPDIVNAVSNWNP
jgi:hypothetical protein